jgi:hypothetical protein
VIINSVVVELDIAELGPHLLFASCPRKFFLERLILECSRLSVPLSDFEFQIVQHRRSFVFQLLSQSLSLLKRFEGLLAFRADFFAVLATAEVAWRDDAVAEEEVRLNCHGFVQACDWGIYVLLKRVYIDLRLYCLANRLRFGLLFLAKVEARNAEHLLVGFAVSVNRIDGPFGLTFKLLPCAQDGVEDRMLARLGQGPGRYSGAHRGI